MTYDCALNSATLGCVNVTSWPTQKEGETVATECTCEGTMCNAGTTNRFQKFTPVIVADFQGG